MTGYATRLMIAAAAFGAATAADAQTANTAINLDDIQSQATVGPQAGVDNQVPYTRGVTPNNIGPGDIVSSNIRDWQGAPGPFGTFQGRRPPIGNAANPTDPLWRYYDRGVDALGDAIGIGQTRGWQRFAGNARLNALTDSRMRQSFSIHCDGKSQEQVQYELSVALNGGPATNCAKQADNMWRGANQRGRNLWNGIQRDVWYGTGLGRAIPQILPGPRVGQ